MEKVLDLKGRYIENASEVQVIIGFKDGVGVRVPLTDIQAGLLLDMFDFSINPVTGELIHATDEELLHQFHLKE